MWPDRVSNPGPLTCESGALPTVLRGPAFDSRITQDWFRYLGSVLGEKCLLHTEMYMVP